MPDTIVLSGNYVDYTIGYNGTNITLDDGLTVTTLTGTEFVVFADRPARIVGSGSDYATVQSGVDAANPNDMILIAPGTYPEQVIIDGKSGISFVEAGGDVTIEFPPVFANNVAGFGATPVVGIYNSTNILMTGITVDGNRAFLGGSMVFFIGIDINTSTAVTIDGVTVTGTRSPESTDPLWTGTDLFGLQDGFSIYAYSSTDVLIVNSTFEDSQKGYIEAGFVGALTIDNNNIVGVGADGRIAQNGIIVYDSPGAKIQFNDVSGISYTDNPAGGFDVYASTGIYIADSDNAFVVHNSVTAPPASNDGTVEDTDGRVVGIVIESSAGTEVANNSISGTPGADYHGGIVLIESDDTLHGNNTLANIDMTLNISLDGTSGNDVFVIPAGSLTPGDVFDGGAGTDRLELGAGEHSLVGVTLTSIEQISLAAGAGNVVELGSAAQALRFTSAPGTDDTAIIMGYLNPTQIAALDTAGFERVVLGSTVGGNTIGKVYIDNVFRELVVTDTDNNQNFETATTFRDVNGVVTGLETVFDTGHTELITFTNGVKSGTFKTDGGDDFPWETQQFTFEPNGVTIARLVETYANTDTRTYTYNEGKLITDAFVDVSDTNADGVDTFTLNYNAAGQRTSYETVYDDGLSVQQTYQNGIRATYTQLDTGNTNASYASLEQTFTPDGFFVATQVYTADNGNKSVTNNVNGGTVEGGAFNDTLTGHLGLDTFVYGAGNDYVANFQDGVDLVDLSAFDFANFAAVQAITVANGVNGVYLTFSPTDHLAINGVSLANFSATDVIV